MVRKRGRFKNATLILLALSPVGALGLILAGPMVRPRQAMAGSYNGTPFEMELKRTSKDALDAVLEAEKTFLRGGGKPRPDFKPWEGLEAHPYVRDAMGALIPGRLVEYADGSMAAAFAMPQAQSEGGGSVLGSLRTRGPLNPVLRGAPDGAILEIRYGPILARKYPAQDRSALSERLSNQGWTPQPMENQPLAAFRRKEWKALASREEDGAWTFFAFMEEIHE